MVYKWKFNGQEYSGARIRKDSKLYKSSRGKTFINHPDFKNYLCPLFVMDDYLYAFETDIPKSKPSRKR